MPANDPVMAVLDRLPLSSSPEDARVDSDVVVPFGIRFATTPRLPRAGDHNKSYWTETVQEATVITNDGTTTTVQDTNSYERED